VRNSRIARRVAALAVVLYGLVASLLVSAAPAMATCKPDDGAQCGPSLGAGDTILLFVVIPIGAFLIIAGLSVLPSALSRPRYRPGKDWEHDSQWFGGPADGTSAGTDSTARGGASAEW
jgi:hypothetical protein